MRCACLLLPATGTWIAVEEDQRNIVGRNYSLTTIVPATKSPIRLVVLLPDATNSPKIPKTGRKSIMSNNLRTRELSTPTLE